MSKPDGFTFRYMSRFGCIGPACEEHCCGGWRIDVDDKHHKMLKLAAGQAGSDRQRIRDSFVKRPPDPELKKGQRQESWLFKLDKAGNCVLLEPDRRCHLHATLGGGLLPDVCAIYPRRVVKLGEQLVLTATLSCPEVARQLLMHEDAVDQVPLEREYIPRKIYQYRIDTRDLRPYIRLMPEVREFALRRLSDAARPFNHRVFALTLFAHRTQAILAKATPRGTDTSVVLDEVRRLDDPAVLDEIGARFDAIRTPALPALLIARELVRQDVAGHRQISFRRLVAEVFHSYAHVDTSAHRLLAANADEALSLAIQAEYEARRARLEAIRGARVERYVKNFLFHSWVHHIQSNAPDLMVFTLRILLNLAAMRFLLVSHPRILAWFAEHPDAADGDESLDTILDECAVEVVRKLGRYIDHSGFLNRLEDMLTDKQMRNLGGAVHLIKF